MYDIILVFFVLNFKYYSSVFSIILLLYLIYKKGYIEIIDDGVFTTLFFASFSYAVLYVVNYGLPIPTIFLIRFVTPIATLIIGYMRANDIEVDIRKDIVIIALVETIHGLANIFINWNKDILAIEGRAYTDIFGNSVSATLQNLFFIISAGLLYYWVTYAKNLKIKIFGIAMAISGVFNSIKTASRTTIILTVIAFFVGYIIYNIEKADLLFTVIRTVFIVFMILIGVYLIYIFDIGEVQEKFAQTELGVRLTRTEKSASFSDNLRWKYALDILQLLPKYPLGGMKYSYFAHNLWVDIAKETGVIPFVAYIVFFIIVIKKIWIFARTIEIDLEIKVMLLPVVFIMLISFFTEPVLQGAPKTFGLFCYFIGIIIAYIDNIGCAYQCGQPRSNIVYYRKNR